MIIEIKINVDSITSNEEAIRQLQQAVYKASQPFYELVGEHSGLISGNGHHRAQELSEIAKEIWVKHQISEPSNIEKRAQHFINMFGDKSFEVIQRCRTGEMFSPFNEDLFEKVEEILNNNPIC
jgi:hypothetical protein